MGMFVCAVFPARSDEEDAFSRGAKIMRIGDVRQAPAWLCFGVPLGSRETTHLSHGGG